MSWQGENILLKFLLQENNLFQNTCTTLKLFSLMLWKMSVLISLIYTVVTFLSTEEQVLIVSGIKNESAFPMVFFLFVFFSLGLRGEKRRFAIVHILYKEAMLLMSLRRTRGSLRERRFALFTMWVLGRYLEVASANGLCCQLCHTAECVTVMHSNQENYRMFFSISLFCILFVFALVWS